MTAGRRYSLELRIPPLALVILFAAAMWGVARLTPTLTLALPSLGVITFALGLGGIGVSIAGVIAFRQANTTVDPRQPEQSAALVRSGIYGYSRNPMYLGFLLGLVAWALWLSHALALLALPAFVAYVNRFQIEPEERALEARFGEAFAGYRRAVRRWL